VLVEDEVLGGVHERMASSDDPREHVEVATPGQRPARVEGLVEPTELQDGHASVAHVAPGAEHACAVREQRVARQGGPGVAGRHPGPPEAAVLLERDLGAGRELEGQHLTGRPTGVRVLRPQLPELGVPAPVDHDVVVQERDHVTGGLVQGPVAGEVEAGERLDDVADVRQSGDGSPGRVVGRGVVDHEELRSREAGPLHRHVHAVQQPCEQDGARTCADGHGEGGVRGRGLPPELVEHGLTDQGLCAGPADDEVDVRGLEPGASRQRLQGEADGSTRPAHDQSHPLLVGCQLHGREGLEHLDLAKGVPHLIPLGSAGHIAGVHDSMRRLSVPITVV
jgi:hypothetical protein